MDITVKSTGFLIDEWITACFKRDATHSYESIIRYELLSAALNKRLEGYYQNEAQWKTLHDLINALRAQSRLCWNAQEEIMGFNEFTFSPYLVNDLSKLERFCEAAVTAQKTNARRNKIIRQIDRFLGEADIMPLEKTYKE